MANFGVPLLSAVGFEGLSILGFWVKGFKTALGFNVLGLRLVQGSQKGFRFYVLRQKWMRDLFKGRR